MVIQIPTFVEVVLTRLNENGYEAYVVGGCVRDAMLGKLADDWDVCTSAMPDQVLSCFSDMRTILTGIEHGTVTVLSDHKPIEITTYRIDGRYTDCRHPDSVTFTASIVEDLARRDFTVNAMAYHPKRGLVDPFGGQQDVSMRVIRCVGDPHTRFREDSLRILRGLRFASVLGFTIDRSTSDAMLDLHLLLKQVAVERVYTELEKMLCGESVASVLTAFRTVFSSVFPDLVWYSDLPDVIDRLPCDLICRFGGMYHKSANIKSALTELKAPKMVRDEVVSLLKACGEKLPIDFPNTRLWFGVYGHECVQRILTLVSALGQNVAELRASVCKIEQDRLCCSISDLAVNGDDLLELGLQPGKQLGVTLKALLCAVVYDQVSNDKQALLNYTAKYLIET